MAGQTCLWCWLFITRLLCISAEDTVHDKLPPECMDGTKSKGLTNLDGMQLYLPKTLLNKNRGYLCQKPWGKSVDPALKDHVQYLTLYDFTHMIPIYSAYVAEPWIYKKKVVDGEEIGERVWVDKARGDRYEEFQNYMGTKKKKYFSENADYREWDTIDRGHLFPVQFTKDWIENKATMKMTNTVPQDRTFNEQQWKTAETILKNAAIKHCQKEEGKAFILTGSVPDYFIGESKEPFKIGCEDDDSKKVCQRDKMRVTVPTHMWTTLRCQTKFTETKGGKPVSVSQTTFHTSFIGSNHRDARVVWYEEFSAFEKDLMKMMNVKTLLTEKPKEGKIPLGVHHEMVKYSGFKSGGSQLFHEGVEAFADWHFGPTNDLHAIRKNNFEQRLKKDLQHIGIFLKRLSIGLIPRKRIARDLTPTKDTDSSKPNTKKVRNKREINSTNETSKYFLLELEDNDPDADIEVSKILIKETYQNGEESQTLDLAGKQIIVDRNNKNENKVTASVNIDGEETELTEVPSTEKFIRIELKPRSEL